MANKPREYKPQLDIDDKKDIIVILDKEHKSRDNGISINECENAGCWFKKVKYAILGDRE